MIPTSAERQRPAINQSRVVGLLVRRGWPTRPRYRSTTTEPRWYASIAAAAGDRHGLIADAGPRPRRRPVLHRDDLERLVVPLGRGRAQVVRAARDHGERLAVAVLHVIR
jgi:hypothetical protein